MATNLTTIEVRLQANAQKFKQEVDKAKKKTKDFGKATTQLKDKGKVATLSYVATEKWLEQLGNRLETNC